MEPRRRGNKQLFFFLFVFALSGFFLGQRARLMHAEELGKVMGFKGRAIQFEDVYRPADLKHPFRKFRGDTIHTVYTSSGNHYQNYQSRIMYATYQMMREMEGGSRHTGFTRILHRTVPDYLMDEVPTLHVQPHNPKCDEWCDYAPAERAHALKAWLDAAAKDPSLINGAWILVVESDYVWMRPMSVPGSAWDPEVSGVQLHFDYIQPMHPTVVPAIKKLYNRSIEDVPSSGAAPVLLRFEELMMLVPSYAEVTVEMENDDDFKKRLGWIREMFAWDIAVARHKNEVTVRTERFPNSTTIAQPPLDVGLGRACMTHYTWGALIHEGIPSEGGRQVYRWEKRDVRRPEQVLKVQPIPMPVPFREGLYTIFDTPLTLPRHDLIVLELTQVNRAIAHLPDLTGYYKTTAEPRILKAIGEREERNKVAKQVT